ncbi:MAG: hypothetical protein QXN95_02470 [Candidatus Bathyarchaeia archaeon]
MGSLTWVVGLIIGIINSVIAYIFAEEEGEFIQSLLPILIGTPVGVAVSLFVGYYVLLAIIFVAGFFLSFYPLAPLYIWQLSGGAITPLTTISIVVLIIFIIAVALSIIIGFFPMVVVDFIFNANAKKISAQKPEGGTIQPLAPPPPPPPPYAGKAFTCRKCGKALTYIHQYRRWYCYNCKEYA